MDSPRPQRNMRLGLGDCWQRQKCPAAFLHDVANEIVDMQALHDDNNRVFGLVVETREQGVCIPLLEGFARRLRMGIRGFQGVVDYDEISAPAGERSPN